MRKTRGTENEEGLIGRGRKISQASQRDRPAKPANSAGSSPALAGEAARFWPKVKRVNGCKAWTGAKTKNGYGRLRVWRDDRWTHVMAHRWAYEQIHGPIPPGIYLDHTCHTNDLSCPGGDTCPHRACVDHEHLEPVDDEENRRRARAQARARRGT